MNCLQLREMNVEWQFVILTPGQKNKEISLCCKRQEYEVNVAAGEVLQSMCTAEKKKNNKLLVLVGEALLTWETEPWVRCPFIPLEEPVDHLFMLHSIRYFFLSYSYGYPFPYQSHRLSERHSEEDKPTVYLVVIFRHPGKFCLMVPEDFMYFWYREVVI